MMHFRKINSVVGDVASSEAVIFKGDRAGLEIHVGEESCPRSASLVEGTAPRSFNHAHASLVSGDQETTSSHIMVGSSECDFRAADKRAPWT